MVTLINKNNKNIVTLKNIKTKFQSHPFHIVDNSPWPILISWTLFFMAIGAVLSMQGFTIGSNLLLLGFITTVSVMFFWFGDINTEGSILGNHTKEVKKGLTIGFFLFVISEVMAFFTVFWAAGHSALAPAVEIVSWPPLGINALDPFSIPLLNTFLLLSSGECHIWNLDSNNFIQPLCLLSNPLSLIPFNSPKINSKKRIGPHNFTILSILICSLLGDGSATRTKNGTMFRYYYSSVNSELALHLYSLINSYGYCSSNLPRKQQRELKSIYCPSLDVYVPALTSQLTRSIIRFNTYSFSSLNWVYSLFYVNNVKVVPSIISYYLTPLTLALWLMDDGCYVKNRGVLIATLSFTEAEVLFLRNLLTSRFGLITSSHASKLEGKYSIYIQKESLPLLIGIVRPFMIPSMLYKLGL